jgi:YegS/Rv2252/BmrU family lipid kinase
MPRKVKLILNPMADMGQAWRVANDLRPIVSQYGGADWSGPVYPTHAAELAKQAALDGYDMVVAMGGDGTVHEVINGLMQAPAENRPALGIVPIGSGNDCAFALGLPNDAPAAMARALSGEPGTMDLGLVVDEFGRKEYFDNSVGIGFNTVVTLNSHKLPVLRGVVMYLAAVIQTILFNHQPSKIKMDFDGQITEQDIQMISICNGPREGGGFMLTPGAKPDDGILNYIIARDMSRPAMFKMLAAVLQETHGKLPQVTLGTCKNVSLSSNVPLYVHTDGEVITGFGSNVKRISVQILPDVLRVVKGAGENK